VPAATQRVASGCREHRARLNPACHGNYFFRAAVHASNNGFSEPETFDDTGCIQLGTFTEGSLNLSGVFASTAELSSAVPGVSCSIAVSPTVLLGVGGGAPTIPSGFRIRSERPRDEEEGDLGIDPEADSAGFEGCCDCCTRRTRSETPRDEADATRFIGGDSPGTDTASPGAVCDC